MKLFLFSSFVLGALIFLCKTCDGILFGKEGESFGNFYHRMESLEPLLDRMSPHPSQMYKEEPLVQAPLITMPSDELAISSSKDDILSSSSKSESESFSNMDSELNSTHISSNLSTPTTNESNSSNLENTNSNSTSLSSITPILPDSTSTESLTHKMSSRPLPSPSSYTVADIDESKSHFSTFVDSSTSKLNTISLDSISSTVTPAILIDNSDSSSSIQSTTSKLTSHETIFINNLTFINNDILLPSDKNYILNKPIKKNSAYFPSKKSHKLFHSAQPEKEFLSSQSNSYLNSESIKDKFIIINQSKLQEEARSSRRKRATVIWPRLSRFFADFYVSVPLLAPTGLAIPFTMGARYRFDMPNVTHFQDNFVSRSLERYDILSWAENLLTSFGMEGRQCILRAVCERSEYNHHFDGLLNELVLMLLSFGDKIPGHGHPLYLDVKEAEEKGGSQGGCHKFYNKCNWSIFSWI